jgi:very-short-patch-repair endonuclease
VEFIFDFLSESWVRNRSTGVNKDFIKKSCHRNLDQHLRRRSRALRTEATVAEKILWEALRKDTCGGYRFLRQHPIAPYVVDFYCAALKLVIEVDGTIHDLPEVQANDQLRQKALEERGLHLLRLTNQEVLTKSTSELRQIVLQEAQRSPSS